MKTLIRKWKDRITWLLKLDLWLLEGLEKQSAKKLVIAWAGFEPDKNYLAGLAFQEGWKERHLERKWLWEILPYVRRTSPSCALLIYEIDRAKKRLFPASGLLQSPVWVRLELPLDESLLSSKVRTKYREIRRKIQKHGFTCSTSKSEADFDDFYHNMYVPLMRNRHGEQSVIDDHQTLKKKFSASGELTFIHKDGRTIAGSLLDRAGGNFQLLCMGTRDGSEEYVKMGVSEALYFFEIGRAREKNGKTVNPGDCRPFFNNGVFRYKISMGAYIAKGRHEPAGYMQFRFLRDTQGLREFLCQNPFIELDKKRSCRGVIFTQKPLPAEGLGQTLKTMGCEGLCDVTVYTFDYKIMDPVQTPEGYRVRFLPASSVLPGAK